jgi:penicillin amidase
LLEAKEKLSPEDFQVIQTDQTSALARDFLGYALERLDSLTEWNQTEEHAITILKEWDFELTTESVAATIFELFYRKSMENLVKDELPAELFGTLLGSRTLMQNLLVNLIEDPHSPLIDIIHTERKESMKDILEISFRETISELSSTLSSNPEDWKWGSVHTFTLRHPLASVKILDRFFKLNRGPFPVPGSFHTVAPYSYSYRRPYDVNHGASQRHIYVTGNWDLSKTVIPTGNSGIPSSPHYCDQTHLYLDGKYHDDPFSRDAVLQQSKFKMEITGIPK